MAKRKRLAPAQGSLPAPAPEVKSFTRFPPAGAAPDRPPIAQVAGDAASVAALEELAEEIRLARETGRMVLNLPLEAVDETYLVRDRMLADEDELKVLEDSIREQGQRTPIEVVELGEGRYGLISGWRRLTALKRLRRHHAGDRHGFVLALLRRPDTASEAYRAMVEENELRVGLSYYERARIVAKAAEQGAYGDDIDALKGLFGAVSRAKRSKIGSFLKLYRALDLRLKFPTAISERLGLAVARALEEDPQLGDRLADRLRKADAQTPEDETALLEKSIRGGAAKQSLTGPLETVTGKKPASRPAPDRVRFGTVTLEAADGGKRLTLTGQGIDPDFRARLEAWLKSAGA